MQQQYDLDKPFDSRFLKFRENFTTREHLLSLHDDLATLGRIHIEGFREVLESQSRQEWQRERHFGSLSRQAEDYIGTQREIGQGIRDLCLGITDVTEAQWATRDAVRETTDRVRETTGEIRALHGTTSGGFRRVDDRLRDIYWAVGTSAELNTRGQRAIVKELQGGFGALGAQLGKIDHGLGDIRSVLEDIQDDTESLIWSVENGFLMLAEGQDEIAGILQEGFESVAQVFHWGLARVAHQLELNRKVYWDVLTATRRPRKTKAAEYREDADRALRNGWWDRVIENLTASLNEWEEDWLAHYDLGRTLWFRYGRWDEALHHFERTARYAGEIGASGKQQYFCAVARVHCGLLWRLHADTLRDRKARADANWNAYRATREAVRRKPGLLMARVEHAANCARLEHPDREAEAFRLIDDDLQRDRKRLLAYIINPEIQRLGVLADYLDQIREQIHQQYAEAAAARARENAEAAAAADLKAKAEAEAVAAAVASTAAAHAEAMRARAEEEARRHRIESRVCVVPRVRSVKGASDSTGAVCLSADGRLLAFTSSKDQLSVQET